MAPHPSYTNETDPDARETLLRAVPLFARLGREELRQFAGQLREFALPAGALLLREGEAGDHLYVLLEGNLEIVKALASTDEHHLSVRGPGEFVGEMSLLNPDGVRTASARATSPVRLLELTRTDFDMLLSKHPAMAYDVARVLSARLQDINTATITDLRQKNEELAGALHDLQVAQVQLLEKQTLERELQLAREVQESILPLSVPTDNRFDFGVRMVPARVVGGDFFDFIPLGGDWLGIVVGDVAGKGMPAAIFMALTRSLLRAEAVRAATPRDALVNVNRHLLDMNSKGLFVTIFFGLLDQGTGTFSSIRAGHELPILVNSRGTLVEYPWAVGQPLGVFDRPQLDEEVIVIEPGATLVLYTDGATEAPNEQARFFGLDRLRSAIITQYEASAQSLCDALFGTITAYIGSAPQWDDIIVLAVHRKA
ncbi:MAG: hypothetical protein NVS4B8_17640 [Herpetosiphon sp.]